jgi:hypothetical protein
MAEAGFCEACGAELHEGAHFCGSCGHVVAGAEAPTEAATAATPATAPVTPAAAGRGLPPWLVPLIAGIAVIAIAALAVVLLAGGDEKKTAQPRGGTPIGEGEVLLEPINAPVPNQFTERTTTGTEPTVQTAAMPAGVPARATSGGQVNGNAPGLYGGTGNVAVCDRDQLIAFLEANPAKARAFAGVLGITSSQIRDYVNSLTPVVLTTDTLVLNHGYSNGKATPRNAVLQAGTAVLIDKYGIPRVKCNCGNPLLPPTITKAARIRGTRWPGFQTTKVTKVTSAEVVNIFVIVNVTTGELTDRPAGTDGTQDTPILIDRQCDLFPDDPACTTTTSSTSTTLAPYTPPTAAPPADTPAPDVPVEPVNTPIDAINDFLNAAGYNYIGDCSYTTLPEDIGSWCSVFYEDHGAYLVFGIGEVAAEPSDTVNVTIEGDHWVVIG